MNTYLSICIPIFLVVKKVVVNHQKIWPIYGLTHWQNQCNHGFQKVHPLVFFGIFRPNTLLPLSLYKALFLSRGLNRQLWEYRIQGYSWIKCTLDVFCSQFWRQKNYIQNIFFKFTLLNKRNKQVHKNCILRNNIICLWNLNLSPTRTIRLIKIQNMPLGF